MNMLFVFLAETLEDELFSPSSNKSRLPSSIRSSNQSSRPKIEHRECFFLQNRTSKIEDGVGFIFFETEDRRRELFVFRSWKPKIGGFFEDMNLLRKFSKEGVLQSWSPKNEEFHVFFEPEERRIPITC